MNSKARSLSRPGWACTPRCCPLRARKIEAFVEWAWDYFSEVKGDQVLDRFSQEDIDWSDSGEDVSGPSAQSTSNKSDS